ncbi:hypothetical protein FACUT_13939 [Fusarium acutatum]|uniref:Uncharacterized protein n=1 Tax=Fusarium acutatum TaxID=78861 RepID=A0A8H4JAH4_9HYPO|nr:hypothetical protein FACUT_13939 [Fusarium acutatum]
MPLRQQHTDLVALRQRLSSEDPEVAPMTIHARTKQVSDKISPTTSPLPACADPPPFLCDSSSRHRSRPRLCSRTMTPSRTQPDGPIDPNTRCSTRPVTLDPSSCNDFWLAGGFASDGLAFTSKIALIQRELIEDARWPAQALAQSSFLRWTHRRGFPQLAVELDYILSIVGAAATLHLGRCGMSQYGYNMVLFGGRVLVALLGDMNRDGCSQAVSLPLNVVKPRELQR